MTKVIFMGSPDFSVPVLDMLIKNYDVIGVVTQPDKPVGRNGMISQTPVKELALKHNIKVYQPNKIRVEYEDIINANPDVIITCAYGQIIPKEILDAPKYGCINVHASLLPKHRGGAPIHRAIIEGDDVTGVTIMQMDVGMDDGDILRQKEIPILDTDTAESLFDKLSLLGAELLESTLPDILDGKITPQVQNHDEATFSYNIKPEDEFVDFNRTRREIFNQIRGLNSWPGAYTLVDGSRMKLWASRIGDFKNGEVGTVTNFYKDGIGVMCTDGEIVLTIIQPEGKKKMNASDYLNGNGVKEELKGKRFGYGREE